MNNPFLDMLQIGAVVAGAPDASAKLASLYARVGLPAADDATDPLELRVARLVAVSGEKRALILEDLALAWSQDIETKRDDVRRIKRIAKPTADVKALVEMAHAKPGIAMFGRHRGLHFAIERRAVLDMFEESKKTGPLPEKPRLLLEYPLADPVVFDITLEADCWSYWDVCTAIADKYKLIYRSPERFGVWGHDMCDLVIEDLRYFPKEQLIYPVMGS